MAIYQITVEGEVIIKEAKEGQTVIAIKAKAPTSIGHPGPFQNSIQQTQMVTF